MRILFKIGEIKIKKMSSFKSNENIQKKDGTYCVVSAKKASSVIL